jgi:hypothetical protein
MRLIALSFRQGNIQGAPEKYYLNYFIFLKPRSSETALLETWIGNGYLHFNFTDDCRACLVPSHKTCDSIMNQGSMFFIQGATQKF